MTAGSHNLYLRLAESASPDAPRLLSRDRAAPVGRASVAFGLLLVGLAVLAVVT